MVRVGAPASRPAGVVTLVFPERVSCSLPCPARLQVQWIDELADKSAHAFGIKASFARWNLQKKVHLCSTCHTIFRFLQSFVYITHVQSKLHKSSTICFNFAQNTHFIDLLHKTPHIVLIR
jgi:hypothetical protein